MSTETRTVSWGSRISSSFKGILVGVIFVVVAVGALFWNEGRTIKRAKALKEAGSVAVTIDPQTLDVNNEGKLVHFSGDVVTDDVITDPEFNISLNAIRLERKVEMYQWVEDTKKETRRAGGGKEEEIVTYSYTKEWSDSLIDSSSFHDAGHDNPASMPYESTSFDAHNVTIGAFTLKSDEIESLSPSVAYEVNNATSNEEVPQDGASADEAPADATLPPEAETPAASSNDSAYQEAASSEKFAQDFTVSTDAGTNDLVLSTDDSQPENVDASDVNVDASDETAQSLTVTDEPEEAPSKFKQIASGYYIGDPSKPKIGDVKVTFSYVATPCPTSFVAQQHGDSLEPYQAKTGSVFLQQSGIHSLQEMIETAQKTNKLFAWLIRAVGLFAIFLGIKGILAPLEVLVDVVPFAAKIVGFGTGIIAVCGTLFLGLGAISIGWVYYRPLIGIPLLVVAVGALFYPLIRGKKKTA